MSGDMLYIWDPLSYGPAPTTFEEAAAKVRELSNGVKGRPSQAILAFAQRMQDVVKLNSNADEAFVQCYGNLVADAQQNDDALFQVELPADGRVLAMQLIIKTANAFNLVVFDDQLGAVFLPNGKVLPESKAEMWHGALAYLEESKGFPQTLTGFKKRFEPIIDAMMAKHGLKKDNEPVFNKPVFIRKVAAGTQYIDINYQGAASSFMIMVSFSIICEPVQDIYEKFEFTKSTYVLGVNLLKNVLDLPGYELELKSQGEVEAMIALIESKLFPLLSEAQDIYGIDRIMNSDYSESLKKFIQSSVYIPKCLIVARLANNPQFEDLVVELDQAIKNFIPWSGQRNQIIHDEWNRLVEYLREKVQPIV